MIRIVTDSASGITKTQAQDLGVDRVSLTVRFAEFAYDQEADPDNAQFYKLLERCKQFPTTSQPSPDAFVKVLSEAKEAGEGVVAVLISSGLSGTIQSAKIAGETVAHPDLHIIDSRCAIMPQRILVEYAVKLRNAGVKVKELVREVERIRDRVKVWGLLDTLTYLYKGGRLPRAAALAGNLLGIKPIVTTREGIIALAGRARNFHALLNKFSQAPGFDPEFPVYFGYTASSEQAEKMETIVREQHAAARTAIFSIGACIGAHVGPNGVAISYVEAE